MVEALWGRAEVEPARVPFPRILPHFCPYSQQLGVNIPIALTATKDMPESRNSLWRGAGIHCGNWKKGDFRYGEGKI